MTEDGTGAVTQVQLANPRTGHDLPARLFSIPNEIAQRR